MNIFTHLSLISAGVLLSSCVYYTPAVPDMPYGEVANRQYPDTWVVTPPAAPNPTEAAVPGLMPLPSSPAAGAPIPAPRPTVTTPAAASVPAPVTPTIPSLKPVTPTSTTITSGANGKLTPTVAKPATLASAAAPTSMAHRLATDPKSITNQGPIPVATRVEGDPTRVYNPLDPSKTIRVVDKNGKPYPSGKELKVRGTNFHFYVP
ncbi:MAG: hypothetical protein IJ498_07715 [Akkermansia sp.]|nr:hypothetical protein [Akkermansia sp.]